MFTILGVSDEIIPILQENEIISKGDDRDSVFMYICGSDIDDMFESKIHCNIVRGILSFLRREVDLSQRVQT